MGHRRSLLFALIWLVCMACARAEGPRSVSPIAMPAATSLEAGAPLADQRSVALGPVTFQVTIARTAQVFYLVDQISMWEPHYHEQYARWADEKHLVGPRERSLLETHKHLRSTSGGWGPLDQAFASTLSIREAASRAVTRGLLTQGDAEQERAVLEAFEPLLSRCLDEGQARLEGFRNLIGERALALARAFTDVQAFADTYTPLAIPLFLVSDPVEHTGGGGYNGGIVWVEVGAGALDVLTHEAIHVVLRDRGRDVAATVGACGAGLDWETLNEGLDYAISPGILHEGGGDPLGRAVDAARTRGRPATDPVVRNQRFGLALRPLVESALAHNGKLTEVLERACAVWRGVAAEAWPPARDAPLAPPLYIVGDDPYRQWLVERFAALSIAIGSFGSDLDALLAHATGHTLVIAIVGDRLPLPETYWPAQTVISLNDLRRREGETPRGVFIRRRNDGTIVYVLYGRNPDAFRQTVDEFLR